MSNEDDTFNALRRIPFNQLLKEVNSLPLMFNGEITSVLSSEEVNWLKDRGWTEFAFKKEWGDFRYHKNSEVANTTWWLEYSNYMQRLKNDRR